MVRFIYFGRAYVQKCAPAVALLLTACAGPLYVHSPSLEKATATAATALPNEAEALTPFEEQMANLDRFASKEDMAVTRYWIGVRDAHFIRLIAMAPSDRKQRLMAQVDQRLIKLTGSSQLAPLIDPTAAHTQKKALESLANSQRQIYADTQGAVPNRDLTCETVTANLSEEDANAYIASGDPLNAPVGAIAQLCRKIAIQDAIINQFASAGGLIKEATQAAAAATQQEAVDFSPHAIALQEQIDRAETFAKTQASAEQLRLFADGVRKVLSDATVGAKAAGWEKVGAGIDKILAAQACFSDTIGGAVEAQCDESKVPPTSTTGRIVAAWELTKALAQIADANDQRRRSIHWLLAAKAIIAAETAGATLAFEEAQALAAAHRQRLTFLQREALYLAQAKVSAHGPRGDCHGGLAGGAAGGDSTANPYCQFASYVDSWNEGRIPAQILEYRPVQMTRLYAVKRQQVIARKQYVLAAAATATLKDYGAGGLNAAIIGQALFDAALLGVSIGGL